MMLLVLGPGGPVTAGRVDRDEIGFFEQPDPYDRPSRSERRRSEVERRKRRRSTAGRTGQFEQQQGPSGSSAQGLQQATFSQAGNVYMGV